LRPRRERPRRRAAKQRDEFAPVHCLVSPALPIKRIARLRDCCVAGFQSGL
jgi:hypothetical protein